MNNIFDTISNLFRIEKMPSAKLNVDHNLSKEELENIKEVILSTPNITQVDFKDDVTVQTIEKIKYLLEISPLVDDKNVEKLVLANFNSKDLKKLLGLNFINPNTWNVVYKKENSSFKVATIPNIRIMEEYFSLIEQALKDKSYTKLELIKEIYDFVKLLNPSMDASDNLPDIIATRKATSYGFSYLFKELLERFNIKSYIVKVSRDKNIFSSVLIDIEDEEYGAKGLYLFDPESDAVLKNLYRNEVIRHINYNFFSLTAREFENTIYEDKLSGELAALVCEMSDFGKRKYHKKSLTKDVELLESTFNLDYDKLREELLNTKPIAKDKMILLITKNIKEEIINLNKNTDIAKIIEENYKAKSKEMFKKEKKEIEPVDIYDI